jgi:GT2 family glycosyltransferase
VTQLDSKPTGISVIMPVYNGAAFIPLSLPPLIAMAKRGEILEVIVVDDGSTDESKQMAQEIGAKVLSSGGRIGPGGARNQAAEIARGDILWFVDADVVVHDDAALNLRRGFDEPQIVAVFGSYDTNPPARNFFSQYKNLVHHYYHQRASNEARTFWSGCGAVRRTAFLNEGGFDVERYQYPSIEDIELGQRLIEHGGRVRLHRDVQCTHLKVWRLGNLLHTEIFRRAIPWSRLILSSGGGIPNELNVGVAEQARALVAAGLLLTLLATPLGCLSPQFLIFPLLLVLFSNIEMAVFFYRSRGLVFACGALLFHQIYYLYSSAAFVLVFIEQRLWMPRYGKTS